MIGMLRETVDEPDFVIGRRWHVMLKNHQLDLIGSRLPDMSNGAANGFSKRTGLRSRTYCRIVARFPATGDIRFAGRRRGRVFGVGL